MPSEHFLVPDLDPKKKMKWFIYSAELVMPPLLVIPHVKNKYK